MKGLVRDLDEEFSGGEEAFEKVLRQEWACFIEGTEQWEGQQSQPEMCGGRGRMCNKEEEATGTAWD